MAFIVWMECMLEMQSSPKMKRSVPSTRNLATVDETRTVPCRCPATTHYDNDSQYFDEKEFFDIAELERKALTTGGS